MSSVPIVWLGALRKPSGYADEARSYLLALEEAGCRPIAREPSWVIGDAQISGRQLSAVQSALARRLPEEYVTVHHYVPNSAQRNQVGAPNVARTMFETDRLPQAFKSRLIDVDEIWVPAQFNVETFARGGLPASRLRVLPETID